VNSWRLQFYSAFTRAFIKPWVRRVKDPVEARRVLENHTRRTAITPSFTCYRNGVVGGVPVLWVSRCAPVSDDILLYVHGGGFVLGSPDSHKHMVAYLAGALGVDTVMPKYRLAPENPFPAGFDDVVATYHGLIASGRRADQIVLGGDSAGGALVLGLLAYLSDQGADLPQSAFLLSPVVDLAGTFDSLKTNAQSEVLLAHERFEELAEMYFGDQDRQQAYASPYYAAFATCPPVLFHCCDGELLRDETLEMQRKLVDLGHPVLVRSWPNAFHVFHLMYGYFPEAKEALDDIVTFVKVHR
jgi:monoterpene epsilon-lactone hydrolase